MGVGSGKGGAAFGVRRVQHGAVCQHHARGNNGLIGVVGGAAAHAAGIVGKDAADKATVDGGRVRPDFFAKFCQNLVGPGADDAGLQGDALGVFAHAPVTPALAYAHKDGIGHRLTGQAGACRAKGHRHAHAVGQSHQLYHFGLVQHVHHDLGDQAVHAGVCAVGQQAQGISMDAVFGNKVQKGFFEFFVGRSKHGQTSVAVHAVIGWALKIALGGELLPLKPGWEPRHFCKCGVC